MPPIRVAAPPKGNRPRLTDRIAAWRAAYAEVADTLMSVQTKGGAPLTPGGLLDISTTAATVAAQLVAGAELD